MNHQYHMYLGQRLVRRPGRWGGDGDGETKQGDPETDPARQTGIGGAACLAIHFQVSSLAEFH
jgi:hypothetical protein